MPNDSNPSIDRPCPPTHRRLAGLVMLSVAASVATLRGPAHADDAPAKVPPFKGGITIPSQRVPPEDARIDLIHVREDMPGFVAFRPAKAFRARGMSRYAALIRDSFVTHLASDLKIDPATLNGPPLALEDIAWVTCNLGFGRAEDGPEGQPLHALILGSPTVRMVQPFDWLAYLRQWRFEFSEAREGDRVFHRVSGPSAPLLGPSPAVYLPDDRTVVFDTEDSIRKLLQRDRPFVPAYLAAPEWGHIDDGLVAVAIDGKAGALLKEYDLGRPDDAVVTSLMQGVERLYVGALGGDTFKLLAEVVCKDGAATDRFVATTKSLMAQARELVEHPGPNAPAGAHHDRGREMLRAMLTGVHIASDEQGAVLRSSEIGTLIDLATVFEAESREVTARNQRDDAATRVKR